MVLNILNKIIDKNTKFEVGIPLLVLYILVFALIFSQHKVKKTHGLRMLLFRLHLGS